MHARIRGLYEEILRRNLQDDLRGAALTHLNSVGASATEAIITLHLAFNMTLEEAEATVYGTKIFPDETFGDMAWEMSVYLMGGEVGPDNPDSVTFKL